MKFSRYIAVVAAVAGLIAFLPSQSTSLAAALERLSTDVATFTSGRYIVKVRGNSNAGVVLSGRANVHEKARSFQHVFNGFAAELTAEEAADLATDNRVLSITKDMVIQVGGAQSRTITNSGLWGIDRIDQRSNALSGTFSALTDGTGVYVYVVDTGLRSTHTQFAGRVISGFTASGTGGVEDCNGHGTHVAGTAVGSSVGVAPGAKVIPVKVLACNGSGFVSDVIAGLEWIATDTTQRPAVVNMSLGGQVFDDLDNAVNNLINLGVPVVVAAGNDAQNACNLSPARVPLAITVAASNTNDAEASFSNFGSCVDIFAPGVGVLSAWHTSNNAGAILDGTSMATPHVAGIVALYLENNPTATPLQVWDFMRINATGCAVTYPVARATRSPNRLLYVGSTLSRPCSPLTVAASTGSGQSEISWLEPEGFSGTSALTYVVTTTPSTAGCTTTAFSCTITGLTNGVTYTVSVTAANSFGTSATAATTTVTPEGIPIAPSISAVTIGNASATLAWGAVPSVSPVTYTAIAQPGGQSCATTSTSCTITGLSNGTTYSFTVVASNISGSGSASAQSLTTLYTAPPAPNINRIRTRSGRVNLRWDLLQVPYPVTYRVNVAGNARSCTTTENLCEVKKLKNGKKYRLTVTATNLVGDGVPSVQTSYVVPGINILRNTIRRNKKILTSKFMTTLSGGRVRYAITKGGCRISSGYVVAPSRKGSCTLQISVSASGAYPSMSNIVKIAVT